MHPGLPISNCRLRPDDDSMSIGNPQSEIGNEKGPALPTTRGLSSNLLETQRLKDSPSCLAGYFTWPQVALTHHVFVTVIETFAVDTVKRHTESLIFAFPIYDLRFTIYHLPRCGVPYTPALSTP